MTLNVLARFYKGQENIFTFNLEYLFIVGLWPFEDLSRTKRILYKLYETTICVTSVTLFVITGIGMYQTRNDITLFLTNLDKCLIVFNFFCKAIAFTINRGQLRTLIKEIEQSGDKVSEERKELTAKYVILITVISLLIFLAFTVLALFEGVMTFDAWMPFDPMESQMNLIIASQILGVLYVPCLIRAFAMKGLVCSLIMYLCEQLDKLQEDIKMLEYSEEREMEVRRKFKKIVKNHVRLMGYSKSMEIIFKEYFLIQNLAVSMEICLNAVLMTVAGARQISLLIMLLAYLSCALVNAYIYCYLGNELMIKSESIALAAYESSWITWPVDLQKDLLILITAAQRPFKLSAAGITLLTIEAFSQIVCNGYSVFAVLNDMVDK